VKARARTVRAWAQFVQIEDSGSSKFGQYCTGAKQAPLYQLLSVYFQIHTTSAQHTERYVGEGRCCNTAGFWLHDTSADTRFLIVLFDFLGRMFADVRQFQLLGMT
jgi:hypothetical protein